MYLTKQMSRYERNNPEFDDGSDLNNMGDRSNRSRMGYSDQDAGEMQPRGNGYRNQRGYGNQRSDDYQQRPDRYNGGRYGADDRGSDHDGDNHDGDNHDGGHDDKKHGTSSGHKAVNIILIIIIILLVVAIVFCILYLTNAWKPSFMKTIFGDNEKFTHKPKASSCSTGVCGYGDKLNDDEQDKKKRKRRSRKIKE